MRQLITFMIRYSSNVSRILESSLLKPKVAERYIGIPFIPLNLYSCCLMKPVDLMIVKTTTYHICCVDDGDEYFGVYLFGDMNHLDDAFAIEC